MKCIQCQNLDLRADAKMSKLGFGMCATGNKWTYQSVTYERECDEYLSADQDTVEKRIEWLSKQGGENANKPE